MPFSHQATAVSIAVSWLQPEVTRAIKDLHLFQYVAQMDIDQVPRTKVTAAKS